MRADMAAAWRCPSLVIAATSCSKSRSAPTRSSAGGGDGALARLAGGGGAGSFGRAPRLAGFGTGPVDAEKKSAGNDIKTINCGSPRKTAKTIGDDGDLWRIADFNEALNGKEEETGRRRAPLHHELEPIQGEDAGLRETRLQPDRHFPAAIDSQGFSARDPRPKISAQAAGSSNGPELPCLGVKNRIRFEAFEIEGNRL